jgi:hypothetical protein
MATQNANAVAITGGTINGTTIGASTASTVRGTTGTFTGALSAASASFTAALPVLSGGTGVTTSTGTGSVVLNTSPTLVTPILGTPTSGNLANCTFPTLNQNTTGTAGGLTGTPNITVGTVNGTTITASTQFSGPGTGLTGTAGSLSIGGNAATATNATTAAACSGNSATASNPASGGTFITSSNIGSQSVSFATNATNATNAVNATTAASCSGNAATASNPSGGGSFITSLNIGGQSVSSAVNATNATNATNAINATNATTATTANALNASNNYNVASLTASGNITAFSDERLKSDIQTFSNALATIQALRGVSYIKDGKAQIGVIAQEVQKVLPQVVQDNDNSYLSVAYGNMVGVLIEAVKELKVEIEELKRGK